MIRHQEHAALESHEGRRAPVGVTRLGEPVCRLATLMDLCIAHQDRRGVKTQIPKRDCIGTGEQLVQGDYPITEFRRKRLELGKSAYTKTAT